MSDTDTQPQTELLVCIVKEHHHVEEILTGFLELGIRGIRKVASLEIPVHGAADLGIAPESVGHAGAALRRLDYFVPAAGEGAEMITGSTEEKVVQLVELLKSKGGVK